MQYRRQVIVAIVVVASGVLLLSQVSSAVNSVVSGTAVVGYATMLLVADVALSVEGVVSRIREVRISREQDALLATLLEAVDNASRKASADLLEYAGISITPVIRRLQDKEMPMRILLKHPDTCGRYQKQRSLSNIEALYNSVLKDARQFEVRCYRAPYSIRGRRIGDHFLEVGWLTPDFGRDTAYGRSQSVRVPGPHDSRRRALAITV